MLLVHKHRLIAILPIILQWYIRSIDRVSFSTPTASTALSNEFIVELKPEAVHDRVGTIVTLECSYNLPFVLIPTWQVNGRDYRVTDLPLGYEATGANLTFRAINSTTIRCSFNAFNVSTGEFVEVYSNKVTVTTTPSPGIYVHYLQAS